MFNMPSKSPTKFIVPFLFSIFLTACGGGGDSASMAPAPSLWSQQKSGTVSTNLMAIAKGADNNVVTVGSGGVILASSDGITWEQRTSGTTNNLNGVIWNGTMFVAVGALGTILSSTDGITWITQTSNTTDTLNGISWNGNGFIAVGGNSLSGTAFVSVDGFTWSARKTLLNKMLRGITWSGSQFVVVGEAGTLHTTPDGSFWSVGGGNDADNSTAVASNGSNRVVYVRSSGRAWYTTDFITWTSKTPPTNLAFYGITWDGTKFIAVGENSIIFVSTDGSTWSNQLTITGGNTLNGVAWNGNKLIAVGNGGDIRTSP